MSMKLHQVLSIAGTVYQMAKNDVRLDLKSPGRAVFTIKAESAVKGLVTLDIGYNDSTLQRHFLGYVERCTTTNRTEQVVACRELTGILANPLPMNLRHVDMRQVLAEVSKQTGLSFKVPDQDYTRVKAPFFYSLASGYLAMDSLAKIYGIPDFVWQQQGNGEVFAGSWADSFFGARSALELPLDLFNDYQGNQSAVIAAIPGLRPGASINNGERITSVALAGTQMAIKWTTQ
ncbi:hypothetical protein KDX38_08385 [Pseudomonas sp. CDFA 602]|uniref:hypothetical protein n=1 Tax=Pseudomonas californiensis TaxID=2829823 RepID=UPI001E4BE326|nr:hypothetical protein [Pseudomonas californiensis]MCD5993637.1 hypothetical protein [Pseudomonas californiensis]MCD5999232.1 hypothetical protein [Pseudomonas californiensis]